MVRPLIPRRARTQDEPPIAEAAPATAGPTRRVRAVVKTVAAEELPTAVDESDEPDDDADADEGGDGTGVYHKSEQARLDAIRDRYLAKAKTPIKAIRAMCVRCMGDQPRAVADCTAPKCPLYPFRMGVNPFYGKKNDE